MGNRYRLVRVDICKGDLLFSLHLVIELLILVTVETLLS